MSFMLESVARKIGVCEAWYAFFMNTHSIGDHMEPEIAAFPIGKWRPISVLVTPGFTQFTVTFVPENMEVFFIKTKEDMFICTNL